MGIRRGAGGAQGVAVAPGAEVEAEAGVEVEVGVAGLDLERASAMDPRGKVWEALDCN